MNYENAQAVLADAVAADPFGMEDFRKLGFWAKVAVKAAENGRPAIARRAMINIDKLEDEAKLDIFADITGVSQALYLAARHADRDARHAAAAK